MFWTWVLNLKYFVSTKTYLILEKEDLVKNITHPTWGVVPSASSPTARESPLTLFLPKSPLTLCLPTITSHLPSFANRPNFLPSEQICPDFLLSTVFAQTHNWPAGLFVNNVEKIGIFLSHEKCTWVRHIHNSIIAGAGKNWSNAEDWYNFRSWLVCASTSKS